MVPPIKCKDHVKDLGIIMSSDCTFNCHIEKLISSAKATSSWILTTTHPLEIPSVTHYRVLLRTLESTEEGSHTGNRGHPNGHMSERYAVPAETIGMLNVLSSEEKRTIPDHIYLENP